MSNKDEEEQGNYLVSAAFSLVTIGLTYWLFPNVIPFSFLEFWKLDNNMILEGIKSSWIIFCWGAVVTLFICVFTRNSGSQNHDAEEMLGIGVLMSLWAGIVEEIVFRWIFFFSAIVALRFCNFFLFGLTEWFFNAIVGPISNIFTLGKISGLLYHPLGWFIGAAIISANAKFRNGHKYQGWFGYIDSWFFGLFLFWILFKYGLPACIAVHFLYDIFTFVIVYIDEVIERARGF